MLFKIGNQDVDSIQITGGSTFNEIGRASCRERVC
jgi:hypothetical protein